MGVNGWVGFDKKSQEISNLMHNNLILEGNKGEGKMKPSA